MSISAKYKRMIVFFLFAGTIAVLPDLYAQDQPMKLIKQIYEALREADFKTATARTDSALATYFRFTPPQLAKIHALRALLYDYNGNKTEVTRHLQLALNLDPSLELDPLFFSPQLQELAKKLKQQTQQKAASPSDNLAAQPVIRYLSIPDPRVGAAWRSLLLPGWGQFYKGQKRRGYVIASLVGGLTIATATAHILRQRAENDYLQATDPQTIQSRYQTFNRYHQLRQNLALATGVMWIAGFVDALFAQPPIQKIGLLSPAIFATPTSLSVGFSIHLFKNPLRRRSR